ncbi:MAG: hypothetical protein IME96_00050 [Proteobacteria bacterium]|nr:hypothetical protein [Pseudomonadota bacterium]
MGFNKLLSAIIIIVLTFTSYNAEADLFDTRKIALQVFEAGEVNWSDMTVRASGTGIRDSNIKNIPVAKLGAERAAKIEATRKLVETIKKVRVDSTSTVEDHLTTSEYVKSRIETVAKRAKIVSMKVSSDEVEVIVEVSLTGLLSEVLISQTSKRDLPSVGDEIYTGLIIDATGLGLKPVISPKILDEAHRELYGTSFISKESAIRQGIAAYEKKMSRAMKSDRVSSNPLVLRGIRASGNNSNIIISQADALALRDKSTNLRFLENCRVIIVID